MDSAEKGANESEQAEAINGRERPNLRQVAEQAGVAMSSVSRVLSGHRDVSPQMRKRVMAVVAELGYEPNLLARSLRQGSTMSVGFVARNIANPIFSQVVRGAETALRGRGYSLLLTDSEGLPELDVEHIRLLRRRRVDGVLLSISDESDRATVDELRRLEVPYVLVDREIDSLPQASLVLSDGATGVREATDYLIGLGHTRLGLVTSPLNTRPGREVERGFQEACSPRGVVGHIEVGPFTREHGEAATERLLSLVPAPTALICGNNQLLPGVLQALRTHGVRVPAELSLVTVDEVPLLEFIEPPIAVVLRNSLEIGREAAALLLRVMGGGGPGRVSIPAPFIPQASCAAPPVDTRA